MTTTENFYREQGYTVPTGEELRKFRKKHDSESYKIFIAYRNFIENYSEENKSIKENKSKGFYPTSLRLPTYTTGELRAMDSLNFIAYRDELIIPGETGNEDILEWKENVARAKGFAVPNGHELDIYRIQRVKPSQSDDLTYEQALVRDFPKKVSDEPAPAPITPDSNLKPTDEVSESGEKQLNYEVEEAAYIRENGVKIIKRDAKRYRTEFEKRLLNEPNLTYRDFLNGIYLTDDDDRLKPQKKRRRSSGTNQF